VSILDSAGSIVASSPYGGPNRAEYTTPALPLFSTSTYYVVINGTAASYTLRLRIE